MVKFRHVEFRRNATVVHSVAQGPKARKKTRRPFKNAFVCKKYILTVKMYTRGPLI